MDGAANPDRTCTCIVRIAGSAMDLYTVPLFPIRQLQLRICGDDEPWMRMISRQSALTPQHQLAQQHPEVDFCVRLKWGSAGGAQLGIRRRVRR